MAIFLVISLEGWTDVMYFVQVCPATLIAATHNHFMHLQDSHSFWNWVYFVCLIVVMKDIKMTLMASCLPKFRLAPSS